MARSYKLLGSLEIEENGRLSPLMKSTKGCALLTYLIFTGQTHPRAHVASLLWEASSTRHALHNLRRLLSVIRPQCPELIVTRRTLGFQPNPATTDVDYLQLRAVFKQTPPAQLDTRQLQQLDEGLQLYRGDLLATFYIEDAPGFNEWLTIAREQLRAQVAAAYRRLCIAYNEAQAWELGIAAAHRWLLLDDLHEETYRWLIQFLLANNQLADAQQQFELCRTRLWDELGVEPDAATQQLAAILDETAVNAPNFTTPVATPWEPDPLPDPLKLTPLGNIPPHSFLPYQRNNDFAGRERDLVQLGQWLLPWEEEKEIGDWVVGLTSQSQSSTVAITGMGGLGKTQLAVEYAHRYGRFYEGGVYWLSFAQAENVAEEVANIGGERGMRLYTAADKLTLADRIGRVQQAWQEPVPRLLIFDNCEDETLLQKWLPVSGGCRVLLTSRHSDWVRDFGIVSHPLATLTRPQSVTLLRRLVPNLPDAAQTDLEEIAASLGDLPLALHLAGSFLHRYQRISAAVYLQQLTQVGLLQHPSLQGRGSTHSPTSHDLNVSRTFALNLEQLDDGDDTDVIARQLLLRAACFAPGEPIPTELLLATLTMAEADSLSGELLAEDGLRRLLSLGFVEMVEQHAVVMHRLLVAFTQEQLGTDAAAQLAVEQLVYDRIHSEGKKNLSLYTIPIRLAHLRHLTDIALQRADGSAALLARVLGGHLNFIAEFNDARRYLQQAVSIHSTLLGADHAETLYSQERLAALLDRIGNYREALTILKKILAAQKQTLGVDHPQTARTHFFIGFNLIRQGAYQLAQPHLEHAVAVTEQGEAQDGALIAAYLDSLGTVYLKLGALAAAEAAFERSMIIVQQELGANHPFTAVSLQNIGLLNLERKAFAKAKAYLDQALSIREKSVGRKHPNTAYSLIALGEWWLAQADYEQARPFFEQALAMQKEVLTDNHPEMASALKNLGVVYQQLGQPTQARPFFEQALAVLTETAVSEHPDFPLLRARLAELGSK